MNTKPKIQRTMKTITPTIIATLFATHAFAAEIPPRAQKKILAAAPEIDLNSRQLTLELHDH
jgi:hypothetical protein